MTASRKQLLFSDVDGLAFAAARGKLDPRDLPATYTPQRLGPLLELLHLSAGGRMPPPGNWLSPNGTASMLTAVAQGRNAGLRTRTIMPGSSAPSGGVRTATTV